jgi:hypothetical protein
LTAALAVCGRSAALGKTGRFKILKQPSPEMRILICAESAFGLHPKMGRHLSQTTKGFSSERGKLIFGFDLH